VQRDPHGGPQTVVMAAASRGNRLMKPRLNVPVSSAFPGAFARRTFMKTNLRDD